MARLDSDSYEEWSDKLVSLLLDLIWFNSEPVFVENAKPCVYFIDPRLVIGHSALISMATSAQAPASAHTGLFLL